MHPEPEHVNFLIRNLAEIVTGIVVILLSLLKILGMKKEAKVAEAILKERPVSHTELMECQMKVNETLTNGLNAIRTELMAEMKDIHLRLDRHLG